MAELGSWLVRAREARGLTLEDAERDTRISRRYLQALETEQFELIPAPVYARGFLRSYSQYLGLDPQEMLMLFPGEEDGYSVQPGRNVGVGRSPNNQQQPGRPSLESPVSGTSPARPHWGVRRPSKQQPQQSPNAMPDRPRVGADQQRQQQPQGQQRPPQRQQPQQPQQQQRPKQAPQQQRPPETRPYEPMIGVDIGVPVPARKIKEDPAAQTRSLTILVVAIAAIVGVVLLAVFISRVGSGGGDDNNGTAATATQGANSTKAAATATSGSSGLNVTPGKVPDLVGQPVDKARLAITEAGFVSKELHQKDTAAKNTVINQAPSPNADLAAGQTVQIVVSDGP